MARMSVRVGPQGRVVIPAALRRSLKLEPGEELVASVEDGRLVLEPVEHVLDRLDGMFADAPGAGSVVDELIADRRREAAREAAEFDL